MKKLLATLALAVAASTAVPAAPAAALACPPNCAVAGVIQDTRIVPNPDQLALEFIWTAVDATGPTVEIHTHLVKVTVDLQINYSPYGPSVTRGDGIAYIDDARGPSFDRAYAVTAIRSGYPGAGTLAIAGTKSHPAVGTYAINLDADYVRYADNTMVLTGVAVEDTSPLTPL